MHQMTERLPVDPEPGVQDRPASDAQFNLRAWLLLAPAAVSTIVGALAIMLADTSTAPFKVGFGVALMMGSIGVVVHLVLREDSHRPTPPKVRPPLRGFPIW